jgi:inhibitor of cysteine peptidase
MMFRLTILLVVALVVLALGACGPVAPKQLNLSEKDAGSTVQLRAGDTLEVVLEGNPTTGYQWEVGAGDTAVIKQVGEAQFQPDTSAIGSPGKITLRFTAVAAGQTALKLIYHRPFEQNVPPVKTFEVTVVVK